MPRLKRIWFRFYRKLRRRLGWPLETRGYMPLPEGYCLFDRGATIEVVKDWGYTNEVIGVFTTATGNRQALFRAAQERVAVHWCSLLN